MIQFVLGILVLIVVYRLTYSHSERGFVDKAAKKAWVSQGELLRTYTDEGKFYGTYEYEADGKMYTLEVEQNTDFSKQYPPKHIGIYYDGRKPQKACIRERSPEHQVKKDWKRGIIFMTAFMLVATFWYFTI